MTGSGDRRSLRVAAIQMLVTADKEQNLRTAGTYVAEAASAGADLVVLPEMFCCPYQTDLFPAYAEPAGGKTWQLLSGLAADHQVCLVGGTMPEIEDHHLYNTSFVFDRQGVQIARHRKMHLFDIAVQGGQHFQESATVTPGQAVTVFATDFCPVGLCVCYDFRFPELARRMVDRGAAVLIVPGAFNSTTGPAHWEVLFRSRAIDNQVFTIGCAPACDQTASYHSWGHTLMVSPWGDILGQLDRGPGWLIRDIDLDAVTRVRRQLPLLAHRRQDLYQLNWPADQAPDTGAARL